MTRQAVVLAALAVCLLLTTECSDSTAPAKAQLGGLSGLIVSEPVSGSGSVAGGTRTLQALTGAGGSAVYVSMVPGTVPTGLLATIHDRADGQSVTAPVVDGGFDPVAIPAAVGDTLVVEVTRGDSAAPLRALELVRANHPPVVVRTDPPPGGRDVPLNAAIIVVFSDPIDPATLTTGSVQLWRDTALVAGTVRFADSAGIRAEFHADSPLATQTNYRLVVTQALRNVDGVDLASAIEVQFTTGATPPPTNLVFASVSSGAMHTCGVTTSGAAYCWGDNSRGELGSGTYASSSTPVPVAGGLSFAAVSAGYLHTCGVTTSGTAYCWGEGGMGQLGVGWPLPSGCDAPGGPHGDECPSPVAVAGGHTFAEVSSGFWHTCGVTADGAAYCWGGGAEGILGCDSLCANGGLAPERVAGSLTFATVSAGQQSSCGVTNGGSAYCWGSNADGDLGTGSTTGPEQCVEYGMPPDTTTYVHGCARSPVAVVGGLTFEAISTGWGSCGLTTSGGAYCWGAGALGSGIAGISAAPAPVEGGLQFVTVTVGGGNACALTTSWSAYCWGYNGAGQLGDGTTTDRSVPVRVAGGLLFVAVNSSGWGWDHTCGVTPAGALYCWGANGQGQLGDGTTTTSSVPVEVAGQSQAAATVRRSRVARPSSH